MVRNDCSFFTALTEAEQVQRTVLRVELKGHPCIALGKGDPRRTESNQLSLSVAGLASPVLSVKHSLTFL